MSRLSYFSSCGVFCDMSGRWEVILCWRFGINKQHLSLFTRCQTLRLSPVNTHARTHTVMFGRLFLFSKVDGGLAVGAVSDKRRDVKWQVDLWALTEQRSSANLSQKLYSLITSSVKSGWMTSNRWALSLRLKTASDPLYFTLSKRFQLFESLCSFSRVSFNS